MRRSAYMSAFPWTTTSRMPVCARRLVWWPATHSSHGKTESEGGVRTARAAMLQCAGLAWTRRAVAAVRVLRLLLAATAVFLFDSTVYLVFRLALALARLS